MDREIPKEVRNKERNKKIIRYSSIGVAGIVVIGILISVMRTGVEKKDLVLSTVDKGMIEVSVSASGKVVPAFEEIINSPINSRIVEVYRKGGDSVEIGTPILKLDLQSTETEYKKLLDEEQMRRYKLDQLRVNNQTKLSDMAMQIKVSAMKLSRMKVELRNEHYLDSLGAGTTDKVRQAELSYNVAQLEYEQLQQQYKNEKEVAAAELKVQELDFNIFRKSLAEMKRTLDDAQIRSPRKAILTYINNQIGAQISQGGQVAIISDLSHFKVEGEIADTYGDRVAAGGKHTALQFLCLFFQVIFPQSTAGHAYQMKNIAIFSYEGTLGFPGLLLPQETAQLVGDKVRQPGAAKIRMCRQPPDSQLSRIQPHILKGKQQTGQAPVGKGEGVFEPCSI